MAECEKAQACLYSNYRLPLNLEESEKYAENYCFGDWDKCARLKLCKAIGKPNVPLDLLPDQHEIADYLIKSITPSWETE